MVRDDLSHDEWLEHLQHELLDGAIYVQRLRTREQTLEAKLRELIAVERLAWKNLEPTEGPDRSSLGVANMLQTLLDEVSE